MTDVIIVALKEYKTREIPGIAANVRILKYFREVGRPEWKSDEIPWCAIFVNWCLMNIGAPTCGTGLAESFLEYGAPTTTPELGDIVVFNGTGFTAQPHHVAFFIRKVNGLVYFLGGNQGDEVNITSAPAEYVTAYRKIVKIKAPDHPSHRYNTATGKLNPKYNPNA